MHLHHTTNALFLSFHRIQNGIATIQNARIHPEKRQRTHKRVCCDLKGQGSKWRFIACWTCIFRFIFFETTNRFDFIWRRQVINHSIQHRLDTFVLECSTAQARDDFTSQCALTQTGFDFRFSQLTFFKVLVHQLFVRFSRRLDHFFTK